MNHTKAISISTVHGGGAPLISHIFYPELAISLFLFLYFRHLRHRSQSATTTVTAWPVVGMMPALATALRGDMYEWITEVLASAGGTFRFDGPRWSNLHCVVTADPQNIEYILSKRFANFPKGEYFRETTRDFLGGGIFASDGEEWRRQRKMASMEFHTPAFRRSAEDSLCRLVNRRLLPLLDKRGMVDLQKVLLELTFDNVCVMALGVDPGCLEHGSEHEGSEFTAAFEVATEAIVARFVTPTVVWKMMRWFGLGKEKKLKEAMEKVDTFVNKVIRARRNELVQNTGLGVMERGCDRWNDLLSAFMRLRDVDGRPYPDDFLRDTCVNFILAGRDTSSVALSWFFWLIDQNPRVEGVIMDELREIVLCRRDRDGEGSMEEVVFSKEEVKKMMYLQASLLEALRLYPSVPLDHKEVEKEDVLPDGTKLEKGMKLIYAIYSMGRMESLWGDDCRMYRPERWMRDGRCVTESSYKFTVFNGGPRLCLGKDFACYQMKFVAASLLWNFRLSILTDHPPMPKLGLTMYMKHGLKVKVHRRSH